MWLKRYPQTRGLLYRLGWKKEDEVSYYSEFLGLSNQISDEDMLTTEEKTANSNSRRFNEPCNSTQKLL